ncbi:polysaccharide deacetylase family protein [Chitinibacter sp. ZOR0017]|uniref:polysaccharide deacetylase family protein n=1 Tax=Chitinibacter sp. ZOR0017 TaxID=1339254 RepID=UPI00068D563B|nr:polysaccharide deacetylase family protein [Chitinibacter sp. ZOR0017]
MHKIWMVIGLLAAELVLAQTPPRLRTPVVENQGQVSAAQLEGQAQRFPQTFFLEGPGDRQVVALTFDDGPSLDTPALLDTLKKEGVKATFFWQGQNVLAHPEIVRRAVAEGHTVANHSFSHPNLSKMEEGGFWWDLQLAKTQSAFQQVVGFQPALMRPPYGFLNDGQIKALQARSVHAILWSVDSADWYHTWKISNESLASAQIHEVVAQYLHPEAIVLLHDSGGRTRRPTVAAVQTLIPAIRAKGYQFVTVDQLLKVPAKLTSAQQAANQPSLDATLQQFLVLFNEPDAAIRAAGWGKILSDDYLHVSAEGVLRGVPAYAGLVTQLRTQIAGLKLELTTPVQQLGEQALFGWRVMDAAGTTVAKGVNVLQLAADGRIKQNTVYNDRQLQ